MWTRLRTSGLWVTLLVCPAAAHAAPPDRGECGGEPRRDLDALTSELRDLAARTDGESIQCLVERVHSGLPPAALLVVLDTVEGPRPELVGLLTDLTQHRRPVVRGRAISGLAQQDDRWAFRAVRMALDDRDAGVRAVGMSLASAHPDRGHVARLRALVRRGDVGAIDALVRSAGPEAFEIQHELRGRVPGPIYARLAGRVLRASSTSEFQRLRLVATLVTIDSAVAHDELRAYVRTPPGEPDVPYRYARRVVEASGS